MSTSGHFPPNRRNCGSRLLRELTPLLQSTGSGPALPPNARKDSNDRHAQQRPRHEIDLTIRLTEAPGAPEYVFRLEASGGALAEGCTLPDSAAALAAVTQHGEDIFFPKPGPPKLCTQQYGGPQVAVVTGWFLGREVSSAVQPHRRLRDRPLARHGAAAGRGCGFHRRDLSRPALTLLPRQPQR